MAWLLRDGDVLASLEVARTAVERCRQMAGRQPGCAALLVERARGAHSLGAGGPIDVAYLDVSLRVIATTSLKANRIGIWRPGTRSVLEAPSGAFGRWGLCAGDHLEVRK